MPVVGVTLVHRRGYFRQVLHENGEQSEQPAFWSPEAFALPLATPVQVMIEGRSVQVRAWQIEIKGREGFVVPILLLDSDLESNGEQDRRITDRLYGGDERLRLKQEIVLGSGGVRMLQALVYRSLEKYHLNEGHASLAGIELLVAGSAGSGESWDFDYARNRCIFTTHTPVAAGHDQFDYELVKEVFGQSVPEEILEMLGGADRLNMTRLALNLSFFVNGVARKHEEISAKLFPNYDFHHVTNGVHSTTWTCESIKNLFDRYIPEWRDDPCMLRKVASAPAEELWKAHQLAKDSLLAEVLLRTGVAFSPEKLTLGFARRATSYQRPTLIFQDLARLRKIAENVPLQLVFAGKAHPGDESGKEAIRQIYHAIKELGASLPIVYLADYDMTLAKQLISGVDLWLTTPLPPMEASGTSGMKAAHNGVPSFSTLDGWWLEGHIEGVTGWAIGGKNLQDADSLYGKLEYEIAPDGFQSCRVRFHSMDHSSIRTEWCNNISRTPIWERATQGPKRRGPHRYRQYPHPNPSIFRPGGFWVECAPKPEASENHLFRK
ncbi:alpha-glucan family phosphorylase [Bdellovibrionota bacterium FG-2]